ncbi:hypothetical protein [Leucobacter sp.]
MHVSAHLQQQLERPCRTRRLGRDGLARLDVDARFLHRFDHGGGQHDLSDQRRLSRGRGVEVGDEGEQRAVVEHEHLELLRFAHLRVLRRLRDHRLHDTADLDGDRVARRGAGVPLAAFVRLPRVARNLALRPRR